MALPSKEQGFIGRITQNEKTVIYNCRVSVVDKTTCKTLPWLAVVSWRYQSLDKTGMPDNLATLQMNLLENALLPFMEHKPSAQPVYHRTGNELKEWVFYVRDRDEFLENVNEALFDLPAFPIEIVFYSDDKWEDYTKLLKEFSKGQ